MPGPMAQHRSIVTDRKSYRHVKAVPVRVIGV